MEELDWARDFVAQQRGATVTGAEPLTGGAWSRAYGIDTADERLVLRLAERADDFHADWLAGALASEKLPVPEVLGMGECDLGHWCLSRRVEGQFLDDLSGPELLETMDSLFDVLDALRTADTSASHGYGGWDASGNAPCASFAEHLVAGTESEAGERLDGWRRKLDAIDGLTDLYLAGVDEIRGRLDVLPLRRQVIHQDLINRNVRVLDGRITGVFDWGCAMYGDHLYDVAWFDFWKPWYPAWAEVDLVGELLRRFDAVGADLTDVAERLRLYRLHIAVSHLKYGAWADSPHLPEVADATRAELEGSRFELPD